MGLFLRSVNMDYQTEIFNTAAYGGKGWTPRKSHLREELGNLWGNCGINNEWSQLKAVLLHRPGPELIDSADPNAVQMLASIDLAKAQSQHDSLALPS